ncbi:hypothetical protein G9A89_013340 [Geosiphon pyriformis]|nr:hypothetical protein G9A89_013340 [Geosiphon pyriformis]
MTRAKSKKAAPDICSEISNKISTKGALFVVEATRQNVLEAFFLSSNHNKLPLIATEATSSSLAGFSPVKVSLKKHTWVSPSIAFTLTKSPKVFNNRPINKLVFPFIDLIPGASNTISLKKIVKKTKSSEKWGQSLASAIVTPNPFVVPNEILDEIPIALSGTLSLPVLEAKQFPSIGLSVLENWADQIETELSSSLVSGAISGVVFTLVSDITFKIKLAYVKALFQSVHGFLNAKSVSKDNVKLFCVEFASQVSLEAAFLVELASSVHLATFKIAKSLVISESGSLSAAVALHDMPLGVSTANIKMALSVFGSVTRVVLKSTGIWQYVVVYFEKLNSAVSALNYWSVLVDKNSVRILSLVNQNETILSCDKFKTKLSGHYFRFALIIFGSQADLDSAVVKTGTLKKCRIWWETSGYQHCFKYQELGYLTADYKRNTSGNCKDSLREDPRQWVDFSSASEKEYINTHNNQELKNNLHRNSKKKAFSVTSDLTKLSALVESIVKPVGSLVKLFEQFINSDLVSSSKLGLKINEVMMYLGFFSKIVGKLEREVVSLKNEYYMKDINMFGDLEHPVDLDNEVFSNLMSLWEHESVDVKSDGLKTTEWLVELVLCSVTLFSVVQKMSALGKFSSRAST